MSLPDTVQDAPHDHSTDRDASMRNTDFHTPLAHLDIPAETDWVELYKCQPPADRPTGASPPIRLDLLSVCLIKGLLSLLAVFFPLPKDRRRVRVEWGAAWLELRPSLVPTLLKDSRDLIELIPDFNEWLHKWATSDERGADCQPAWAHRRGFGVDCVRQIAESVVKHLADSSQKTIRVANETGMRAELRLPPKPQLVAPKASLTETEIFRVDETQTMTTYITHSGRIVICICADAPTDSADSVEIDLRRLDQISITSSSRVRPIGTEDEEEDAT